jgi:hypothetical protein
LEARQAATCFTPFQNETLKRNVVEFAPDAAMKKPARGSYPK